MNPLRFVAGELYKIVTDMAMWLFVLSVLVVIGFAAWAWFAL